jgi:hypothetical protein
VTEPVADGAALALTNGAALALAEGAIPVCRWLILPYDTRGFPFAELLKRDVFGVKRLDLLHEYLRRRRRALGADDAEPPEDAGPFA